MGQEANLQVPAAKQAQRQGIPPAIANHHRDVLVEGVWHTQSGKAVRGGVGVRQWAGQPGTLRSGAEAARRVRYRAPGEGGGVASGTVGLEYGVVHMGCVHIGVAGPW